MKKELFFKDKDNHSGYKEGMVWADNLDFFTPETDWTPLSAYHPDDLNKIVKHASKKDYQYMRPTAKLPRPEQKELFAVGIYGESFVNNFINELLKG